MKVSIIGGGGRVGSNAAFALQCAGIVSEIQILDANGDLALGEALDLLHGSSVIADQRIYAGDYARAADSDIFVITAGLRRKPDESRLDLINRNVALFEQILASLKTAGFRKDALIFVVSNPVDILTQLAVVRLGLPWKQVLGLGTMLDTARFRSLLADELKLAPTQVKALILGEHGDTMLPIWSSATAAGLPASPPRSKPNSSNVPKGAEPKSFAAKAARAGRSASPLQKSSIVSPKTGVSSFQSRPFSRASTDCATSRSAFRPSWVAVV